MDCQPGQKRSGRYGEVTVSGGSTVRINGFNSGYEIKHSFF